MREKDGWPGAERGGGPIHTADATVKTPTVHWTVGKKKKTDCWIGAAEKVDPGGGERTNKKNQESPTLGDSKRGETSFEIRKGPGWVGGS